MSPEGVRRVRPAAPATASHARAANQLMVPAPTGRRGFCAACGTPLYRRRQGAGSRHRTLHPTLAAPVAAAEPCRQAPFVDGIHALPVREFTPRFAGRAVHGLDREPSAPATTTRKAGRNEPARPQQHGNAEMAALRPHRSGALIVVIVLIVAVAAGIPGRDHMNRERLYLFDTTLRDGAQTPGVDFLVDDKIADRHHAGRSRRRLRRGRLSRRQPDRHGILLRGSARQGANFTASA